MKNSSPALSIEESRFTVPIRLEPSGVLVDLLELPRYALTPERLGRVLSRIARFGGHSSRPYSVAEHSVLVLEIGRILDPKLSREAELALLLHDAPEAFVGDMISPIKHKVTGFYRQLENTVGDQVAEAYGIDAAQLGALWVKRADMIALRLEQWHFHHRRWQPGEVPEECHHLLASFGPRPCRGWLAEILGAVRHRPQLVARRFTSELRALLPANASVSVGHLFLDDDLGAC